MEKKQWTIKDEAKAIVALAVRNGYLEDIHAEGLVVDDEVMKKLIKEVVNRVYTLLLLREENIKKYIATLAIQNFFYTRRWADPEKDDEVTKASEIITKLMKKKGVDLQKV